MAKTSGRNRRDFPKGGEEQDVEIKNPPNPWQSNGLRIFEGKRSRTAIKNFTPSSSQCQYGIAKVVKYLTPAKQIKKTIKRQ